MITIGMAIRAAGERFGVDTDDWWNCGGEFPHPENDCDGYPHPFNIWWADLCSVLRPFSGRGRLSHLREVELQLARKQKLFSIPDVVGWERTMLLSEATELDEAYTRLISLVPSGEYMRIVAEHVYERIAWTSWESLGPEFASAILTVRVGKQREFTELIRVWIKAIELGGPAVGYACEDARISGREYRSSSWFRWRRQRSYMLAKGLCQCCGVALQGHFDLHHKEGKFPGLHPSLGSYALLGMEPDDSVEVLCRACHDPRAGLRRTPEGVPLLWSLE